MGSTEHSGSGRAGGERLEPEEAAPLLRERVYGTITALATLATLSTGDHHAEAGNAIWTLLITVLALWLASVFADVVGHVAAHQRWPRALEWRHMLRSTGQILTCLPIPLALLGAAAIGLWEVDTALYWAAGFQVLTLGLMGGLAVRTLPLSLLTKLSVIAVEVALGLAVVGAKLLVH